MPSQSRDDSSITSLDFHDSSGSSTHSQDSSDDSFPDSLQDSAILFAAHLKKLDRSVSRMVVLDTPHATHHQNGVGRAA
jgi:hypothetical protein